MSKETWKNIGIFAGCLILCQAAGVVGTIATIPNIPTWYASLNKPSFQPPNWLFGPVWTILYTLMAVALYTLIKSDSPAKRKAIVIFAVQLVLNAVWSFLFFEFHYLLGSLVEISALLLTLIYFCIVAWPVSRIAVYCFIPYIVWVSFASILNGCAWNLN